MSDRRLLAINMDRPVRIMFILLLLSYEKRASVSLHIGPILYKIIITHGRWTATSGVTNSLWMAENNIIYIGVASMRQEEAIASSWIFRLTMVLSVVCQARTKNDPNSTNYRKLYIVFILQRCATKTLQQLSSMQKFPRGLYPGPSF